ncbi:MAG TPA: GNAT family N-acetyltransferase [Bacteroidia bacterium]|jgi:predicted GNAT family acetyltransferase|nr:GNAT family N-acetyltransferase [Bacteroidia bacterium]
MENPIINNEKLSRFEMEVNGEFAYIKYRPYKGNIAIMHTFVPESARGKGIASVLAKFVLEYFKQQNKKLMVYCPVVAKFIKEHPEYEPLLNKEYRG